MVIYGISTCDTCKAAQRTLVRAGHQVSFRDVRAAPLTEAEIARFVGEFGDRLVNRQSATWRSFSDFLKASDTEAQIAAQPTVMKRPLIEHEGRLWLGWDKDIEAALA
jgi:arsenate reductase-like glutaredoxin family protein